MATADQQARLDRLVAKLAAGQRTSDVHAVRAAMAAHMDGLSFPLSAAGTREHIGPGIPVLRLTPHGAARPSFAVLYVHGGGFVCGTAAQYGRFVAYLCALTGGTGIVPDYRLAPEYPYPAAIEDVVAVWQGLLGEFGSASGTPARVAVVADSAGATIALRALSSLRRIVPQPACALVLLSPLVDLTGAAESLKSNRGRDKLVSGPGISAMARMYAPGRDPADPDVSPVFSDLTGYPPMLIQASTSEALRDDAEQLAERARSQGTDVTLQVTPDMPHVWQVFAGFLSEGEAAVNQAAHFIRALIPASASGLMSGRPEP